MLTEDGAGEEPMPEVDWCGVVHVRADGYDVYEFEVGEAAFRAFLYAKYVGEFFGDDGGASQAKSDALPAPIQEAVA
jgi:hypothetical protein